MMTSHAAELNATKSRMMPSRAAKLDSTANRHMMPRRIAELQTLDEGTAMAPTHYAYEALDSGFGQSRARRLQIESMSSIVNNLREPVMDKRMCNGPVSRQLEKEEEWKRKLTRETTSWWDVAAIGMPSDPSSADTKALEADSELHNLGRGRIHARTELKAETTWRQHAIDNFLGLPLASPASPQRSLTTLEPISGIPDPQQPDHLARKYGWPPAGARLINARRKRGLKPIPATMRGQLEDPAAKTAQREAGNARARQAAFCLDPARPVLGMA